MPKIQLSKRSTGNTGFRNNQTPQSDGRYTYGRDSGRYTTGFNNDTNHTGVSDDSIDYRNLESMVLASDAYQNALALFTSDTRYGAPYLTRLQQIPSVAVDAEQTIWDVIGWSNKADDKDFATFQMCIEQINNLVAEYYQFINSLPSTQVQQQLEAGVYGIMSGDSVSASEMNPQQGSISSAQMESTNPLENALSIGNFALSFCTTGLSAITSAWSSIQNVRNQKKQIDISEESLSLSKEQFDLDKQRYNLNEQQFLSSLWTTLDSHGYNMPSTAFQSYDDFLSWAETYSVDDPHSQNKRSTASRAATIAGIYDMSLAPFRRRDPLSIDSFGGDFARLYNDIGNFQIEQAYYALKYSASLSKNDAQYQSGLSISDKLTADNAAFKRQIQESKFLRLLNENKIKFFVEQLNKVKESNDPLSKFALTQMMFNDPLLSKVSTASQVTSPLLKAMQDTADRVNDPSNPAFYLEDM